MSLYKRTLITIALNLTCLVVLLYGVSHFILLRSFSELEHQEAIRGITLVRNSLTSSLEHFSDETADWAAWDDTYTFVQDQNQNYITSNLNDKTFVNLKLNLILFINRQGKIAYGRAFEPNTEKEMPIPADIKHHLTTDSPLLQATGPKSSVSGILQLNDGAMLFVVRPILTSERKGPPMGVLFMGRYLDLPAVDRLSKTVNLHLTMVRADDPLMPPDFKEAKSVILDSKKDYFKILSNSRIASYSLFNDVYNKPAMLLKVDLPRNIYKQGQVIIYYFIISILIAGIIFGGHALFMLDKLILSRLSSLSASVSKIGAKRDLTERVPVSGAGEMADLAKNINKMLDDIQRVKATLKESEVKYDRLFDNALNGNFVAAPDGTIKKCNFSFAGIFGFSSPDKAVGGSLSALFAESDHFKNFIEMLKNGERISFVEMEMKKSSGEKMLLLVNAEATTDESSQILEISGNVLDTSEMNRAMDEIRTLNEHLSHQAAEMEIANRELEAFSSSVSHDLKKPLAKMSGFVDLLEKLEPVAADEKSIEYVNQIKMATRQMEQLIVSLFKLSQISNSELTLGEISLSGIAEEVAADLKLADSERAVTFTIAPDLLVTADATLIHTALENLLANAWKFTRNTEEPLIEVGVQDHENQKVYFVRDNGAGFDMGAADKLFEPFQKLHDDADYPGTGVGLATVQRIIKRHGGRIWAEATINAGATFFFTFSPTTLPQENNN